MISYVSYACIKFITNYFYLLVILSIIEMRISTRILFHLFFRFFLFFYYILLQHLAETARIPFVFTEAEGELVADI
jgi:NADH:ubiquinone oxidoreductase subunit H